MEIYLFGCKDTSLHVANFLTKKNINIHLVTIDKDTAFKNQVAGFLDLTKYPKLFKSIYIAKSYSLKNQIDIEHFKNQSNCNLAFCVGWQRLIPSNVLNIFNLGVHGMHGSARDLPFGKGRSPMNWAIIEGRKFFHTNLFKYQSGIDNGPILDKSIFSINTSDTSETMHYKNVVSMCHLIEKNIDSIARGESHYKQQNTHEGESFYPKRSPSDGVIDWRDDINNIEKLIRAVAPPFYGALGFINNFEVRIFRASIFFTDIESHPYIQNSNGEILEVFPSKKFLVRCSNGVLLVHEHNAINLTAGSYFKMKDSPFNNFKRNVFGFFDI